MGWGMGNHFIAQRIPRLCLLQDLSLSSSTVTKGMVGRVKEELRHSKLDRRLSLLCQH